MASPLDTQHTPATVSRKADATPVAPARKAPNPDAPALNATKPGTAANPSTPNPGPPAGDPLLVGPRGPYLLAATPVDARGKVRQAAAHYDLLWGETRAYSLSLGRPAADGMLCALRDQLYVRTRRLERVYEGRIVAIRPGAPARGSLDRRLNPSSLAVELETEDDRRTLQLEGSFAYALSSLGAGPGDIIQIAQKAPLAALRRDREESDGLVAGERDFIHRARLFDQDRYWDQNVEPRAPETIDAPPAPALPPILGTGMRPTPPMNAMRATDAWVQARLSEKGSALEPGILLITHATELAPDAVRVLREAVASGTAPIVILQDEDKAALAELGKLFDEAVVWPSK